LLQQWELIAIICGSALGVFVLGIMAIVCCRNR